MHVVKILFNSSDFYSIISAVLLVSGSTKLHKKTWRLLWRLRYSLLYGLLNYQVKKLQHVLYAAARLISLSRKHEHITPILLNLHWLLIHYRIVFKILLITYKALNNLAPLYIRELLTPYVPARQLRLSSKNLLVIPHFNLKTYGARSFSIAAPTLWTTLPSDIINSSSVSVFKNKLKTFLFKKAVL